MVLRGLPVPLAKRLYIVRDVNREARRLGVPFGTISDPLPAAQRCIALFVEARELGKEREWLLAIGRAVWAEGVDITIPEKLRRIARQLGIPAQRIQEAEQSDAAVRLAANNRESLAKAGLWGVPSYVCGDIAVWGQDRLGFLTHRLSD